MSYFAMARRYRPQTFADVAAQSHITETLKRAMAADRVAPAYLFTGPRGSGKTTVARILAKAVNCDAVRDGEPCAACESCTNIATGRSMDVLEIDGASNNSVDDVRELRENVGYAASAPGKRKVYIIDEVHMLSTGAFNALLKTLEEPPAHVLFVFATTEPRKVPQTILSRCQRFDFRRLLTDEIRERLARICKKEKVDIDASALFVIAKRADGSMRDGMSLLDQVISSTSGSIREKQVAEVLGLVREEIYIDLTAAILERNPVAALQLLHAALREGADPSGFALGLVEHLRNLLLLSVDPELKASVQLGETHLERVQELAQRFRTEDILYLLNRAAAVYEDARNLSNPSVVLEAALVELAHFESRVVLREVLDKLDAGSGGSTTTGARGASGGQSGAAPGRPARGAGGTKASEHGAATGRRGSARTPKAAARPWSDAGAGRVAAGGVYTPPRAQPSNALATSATADAAPESVRAAPGTVRAAPESARAAPETAPRTPAAGVDGFFAASQALRVEPTGDNPVAEELDRSTQTAVRTPLELGSVHARWRDFTRTLGGSKAMLAQCLSDGVPSRLEGSTLEVAFTPAHAFHMNLLEDRATRSELEQQLEVFFGRPLHVRLTQRDAHPASVIDATQLGTTPVEALQVEPPQVEATPVDATPARPRAEAAQDDAPRAEVTQADAPQAEAPQAEAPQAEAPQAEAPQAEAKQARVAPAPGAATRLTDADIAQSRLAALADVVQKAPRVQDIVDAFDAEILDERERQP